jgi:hypothetical protein
MAFPTTPLDVRLVFAFGANLAAAPTTWLFKDCTADLRTTSDSSVAITVGRSNRAKQGEPNTATLSLNNLSGQYTVDNPAGANYPYIDENVPGIVATARNLNPTFEVDASDWGAFHGSVARSTVRAFSGAGSLLLTPLGGFATCFATTAAFVPVRDGGAVYVDAWVYSVAGWGSVNVSVDWFNSLGVTTGTTNGPSIAVPAGVWTYIGGYLGPAPVGTAQCLAKVVMTGTPGATNTLWIDEARLSVPELCGYVDGWTPVFDDSGKLATVDVSMSGVRRRLSRSNDVLHSALYRTISAGATVPVAWWPMEDGSIATQAASGLSTGAPLTFRGTPNFAALSDLPGAASEPDLKAVTSMIGPVAMPATGQWQVQFWTRNAATGSPAQRTIMRWTTNEARNPAWDVVIDNQGGGIVVSTIDSTGASISTMSAPIGMDDKWHHIAVIVTTVDPTHVNVVLYADGVNLGNITNGSGSYGTGQITSILMGSQVDVFGTVNGGTYGLSHVAVYSTATYVNLYSPGIGFAGLETAGARVGRLCGEEFVPVATISNAFASMPMGAQLVRSLVDLLQDCEDADGGMLIEPFDQFGFDYIVRANLYNLPAALVLDVAQDQLAPPFAPLHDDLLRVNDSTVTRQGGASARFVGDTSRGTYKETPTINNANDGALLNIAGWRVHLGKPRGRLRHPSLNVNFANPNAAQFGPAFAATRGVGIRVQVVNPPPQMYQGVDILVSGYTKTLAYKAWKLGLLGSPYDPWIVAQLGNWPLELAGQTLQSSLAPGATTLSLATAAGYCLFTTTARFPNDFPLDLNVGGWRVHVTGATGASSPQSLTCTASPNTSTTPAGTPVTLWQPAPLAL